MKNYTIDAKGKSLGRVASAAAKILLGKADTKNERHIVSDVNVKVINCSKINISEKKFSIKDKEKYTQYPGGFTYTSYEEIAKKKGYREVMRLVIKGMLPKNRLEKPRLKRLTVEE